MKTENMTSFRRRKVIADSKGERDAAAAASNQVESLDSIGYKLDSVQSATELTSEAIEQKSNDIISAVNDTTAGVELTAEFAENTSKTVRELTDVTSAISDKISKLTDMLEQKIQAVQQKFVDSSKVTDDTLKVIGDSIPEPVESNLPAIPEKIFDKPEENNSPDADFFPTLPSKAEEVDNKKDSDKKILDTENLLKDLVGTTKTGFKATVSITDKISNMLFKYTVSALAESAKLAGTIFAIVLGIDLLRAHFKYWSDKFSSNFDEFSQSAGEWGSLLQSVLGSLQEIKKFWENNDWSGLAVAIVKGLADVLYNLSELMSLGISKISAAILSALGFDNAALSIKGAALEGFQARTGNELNEEDQDTLARYQTRRIQEGPDAFDKFSEYKTRAFDFITGRDNKNTTTTEQEREAEVKKLKSLPEEELNEINKKSNNARAALVRFEKYMGDVDPENATNIESLDKAYNNVKSLVNDSELNKAPAIKKELEVRLQKAEARYQKIKTESKPEPAAPSASEDVQKVQNIEKAEQAKKSDANQNSSSSVVNAQVNNVNNSRTIQTINPVTATPAPGVFKATGVN
ncbi:baseplate hub subunit tail length determinator [Salmonella phage STP4-a]|uniref:Baseplate hub subunit tail length determinator n=1 Tax=Salmonella phage STP4-a TaxID=1445860 RepID=A0A0B4L9W9_9CAUD|nr:baseplate hub subunit and tail length [Salmonella phage STP4-a]AHJ86783.1 baseplate hub subunit tail length determinator [Salmonella phage STP4-a]UFK27052.1 hypothetical protein LG358_00031 [Escherichia phage UoN_LG358_1]